MGEMRKNLRVRTRAGIKRLSTLIDSGAECNFLNMSVIESSLPQIKKDSVMFKKIGGYERLIGEKEKFELGDGSVKIGYISRVSILWRNRYISTDVIVTKDIKEKLVLGQPFLQINDVILNFKNDSFTLGKYAPKYYKRPRL